MLNLQLDNGQKRQTGFRYAKKDTKSCFIHGVGERYFKGEELYFLFKRLRKMAKVSMTLIIRNMDYWATELYF